MSENADLDFVSHDHAGGGVVAEGGASCESARDVYEAVNNGAWDRYLNASDEAWVRYVSRSQEAMEEYDLADSEARARYLAQRESAWRWYMTINDAARGADDEKLSV